MLLCNRNTLLFVLKSLHFKLFIQYPHSCNLILFHYTFCNYPQSNHILLFPSILSYSFLQLFYIICSQLLPFRCHLIMISPISISSYHTFFHFLVILPFLSHSSIFVSSYHNCFPYRLLSIFVILPSGPLGSRSRGCGGCNCRSSTRVKGAYIR